MKVLILILSLLNVTTEFKSCNKYKSCATDDNVIVWNKTKKLAWIDFNGEKIIDSKFVAVSYITLKLDYQLKDNYLNKFKVCCLFFKNDSWTIDSTGYGLNHEQKHFDIGEINARLLRQELIDINKEKKYVTSKIIDSIFNSSFVKLRIMQTEYDNQTGLSLYYDGQEKWDAKIQVMLDSLKEYR